MPARMPCGSRRTTWETPASADRRRRPARSASRSAPTTPRSRCPVRSRVESNSFTFSAATGNPITVGLANGGNGVVQVSLAATNGTITLGGTAGLTFSPGSSPAGTTMTVTGTVSAVNAALNGLAFVPAGLSSVCRSRSSTRPALLAHGRGDCHYASPADTAADAQSTDTFAHAAPGGSDRTGRDRASIPRGRKHANQCGSPGSARPVRQPGGVERFARPDRQHDAGQRRAMDSRRAEPEHYATAVANLTARLPNVIQSRLTNENQLVWNEIDALGARLRRDGEPGTMTIGAATCLAGVVGGIRRVVPASRHVPGRHPIGDAGLDVLRPAPRARILGKGRRRQTHSRQTGEFRFRF